MNRTPMPPRRTAMPRGEIKAKRPRDTGPSPRVRAIVHGRSGGQCEFPFCPDAAVNIHHRRPRGSGGDPRPAANRASNLLDLCLTHHLWAESNRDDAEVFGLLMPWETPDPSAVWVVTRHHSGPVYLDDEGGWRHAE